MGRRRLSVKPDIITFRWTFARGRAEQFAAGVRTGRAATKAYPKKIIARTYGSRGIPKSVPFGSFKKSLRGKLEIPLETFLDTFSVTKKYRK